MSDLQHEVYQLLESAFTEAFLCACKIIKNSGSVIVDNLFSTFYNMLPLLLLENTSVCFLEELH